MKKVLSCIVLAAMLIAMAWEGLVLASEYYIVKSRSGAVRIVDHQPQGGASIVKGPFSTKEEAEDAMKSTPDARSRGTRQK